MSISRAMPALYQGCALLIISSLLITPTEAQVADAIVGFVGVYADFYDTGKCSSSSGRVILTTYLDAGVQSAQSKNTLTLDEQPNGKILAGGPVLLHRKDLQNWPDNNGDWCVGGDPIPYPIPANSSVNWKIGSEKGSFFSAEVFMYFQVVLPSGEATPCLLTLHQYDGYRDHTATLEKSVECNGVESVKNLRIIQSGMYCDTGYGGYNGPSSRQQPGYTKVGVSDGACPNSNQSPIAGELENRDISFTSFSVYWDPMPSTSGTAVAAGFTSNFTTFGPEAAPSSSPSSGASKLSTGISFFTTGFVVAISMMLLSSIV